MCQHLDLLWQVGDSIKGKPYTSASEFRAHTIVSFDEDGNAVVQARGSAPFTIERPGDWEFACHNQGAPFESTKLDEDAQYRDGYDSGYCMFAERGQRYTAGGPHVTKVSPNECRHLQQAHQFQEKNNRAFVRGWKQGQLEAQMIENRTLYQAVFPEGESHTFPTHRAASDFVRGPGSNASIVTVEQQRDGVRGKWTIVSVGGPIDPLPPLEKRTLRYSAAGTKLSDNYLGRAYDGEQYVDLTFDGGKIVDARLRS